MPLAILFHFLCAQHVSDINISIIRSLRLFSWITTLVVLFLVRCVLEFRCGWVGDRETETVNSWALTLLGRSVLGLSPQKTWFIPSSVHVGFIVDEVAMRRDLLLVLKFYPMYMSNKNQLDATLCSFYFFRVTLHVSGASAHQQEYLKLVQRPLVHVFCKIYNILTLTWLILWCTEKQN